MSYRPIHTIHKNGYDIFITDLSEASEEEVCNTFDKVKEKGVESKIPFGVINKTDRLMATPKMRQKGASVSKRLTETGNLIGMSIYGFNSFLTYVAKMAFREIQFGSTEEECIEILNRLYKKKKK